MIFSHNLKIYLVLNTDGLSMDVLPDFTDRGCKMTHEEKKDEYLLMLPAASGFAVPSMPGR